MHRNKFLAFDIGASSGRAIIGHLNDNIISLKEIYRFYNGMTLIHGRYHWDIFRIFEDIKKGMKEAVDQNEIPASIGIDTWGVDYGLLDEAGHILELPYAYRDHRTDKAMDDLFRIIPKEELYNLTGIQFLQFNTVFQLYAAVRDRLPIMKLSEDLLFIPDLLNYLLTGVKRSEFSFATTSQLYNPRTKAWAPEIFEKIGISVDIMQEIVDPGSIIGGLSEDILNETGMPRVMVTAVASHDTGSAIAAIPAEDEDFAYISSGTWSLMGIESNIPVISLKSLAFNFTNEGGVAGTFRVLKNIMGLWLIQECKRSWADAGADFSYQALANMASSSKHFKTLIDPDHSSLLNPKNMPEALSSLARTAMEPEMENPGEFSRCIFESLAFRYRQTVEELKQISDKDIRKIHIIGGGSQNELLCRFTANATGLPVIAGPAEGTALGNIMVQALSQGEIGSLSEIRHIIRKSFEFKEYFPESISEWNSNYSRFLEVCKRTKS
jgi:rhamnulokinase